MGTKKKDEPVPTDPDDPNFIRKLSPREMEFLKGGAQPGPSEIPDGLPPRRR